jgi:hypothetical protein
MGLKFLWNIYYRYVAPTALENVGALAESRKLK